MPILSDWSVSNLAVWREERDDQIISVRHPTYPVEAEWKVDDPDALRKIVAGYLAKVAETLGLPSGLLDKNGRFTEKNRLVWLPFPDRDESADPGRSLWLNRYDDPLKRKTPIDRSLIALAVESKEPNEIETAFGSRLGIRVIAHVSNRKGLKLNVRITGAARSLALRKSVRFIGAATVQKFLGYYFDNHADLKRAIRGAAGVSEGELWLDGMRVLDEKKRTRVALYANVPRPPGGDPSAPAYALTARGVFDPPKTANAGRRRGRNALPSGKFQIRSVERFPLVAHAKGVEADLFPQDPASVAGPGGIIGARPNRSPQRLERFRRGERLNGITLDPRGETTLLDDLNLVKVTQSKLVERTADEDKPEEVEPANVAHARTNPFAALSGYQRTRAEFDQDHQRALFDTIAAYGLSPFDYFRLAAEPLLVRYRAPIRPGPGEDGKTVNADVDYDPCNCSLVPPPIPWDPAMRGRVQVNFALADLKRSASRREPLGLTADPRWSWHEYCHALLAAMTGALEFPFVHSAGDALAAIVNDPWSKLAVDPWLRGCTFPWVYLHRRHDRSVFRGWGWSGRYHRPARFDLGGDNGRRKGYQSEQILSTSLFRLYRALGGDTVRRNLTPDEPARQRAADYTTYLILRMIRLLPPAVWNAVETPDQLVSKLIDADIGTWPAPTGPLAGRVGGWAHKVVRWAFEAQGLYATTNASDVKDEPGKPPPVDIFIDTRRPDVDGGYPRGGYAPVSLDWHAAPGPSPWHASADAIRVNNANRRIRVEVRNRGKDPATGVWVHVWWTAQPPGAPLKWDPSKWGAPPKPPKPAQWNYLGKSGPNSIQPWPAPPVSFGGFRLPVLPRGTRVVILAAATCDADPANIDPATGLPCAIDPTPIVDLVAGDNNLGLRLHTVR